MTITDVSTAYKNTVSALLERLEYLVRSHGCRTQGPDGSKVRRILESAYTSQIGASVSAPITKETDNFGFKLTLGHIYSSV